MAKKITSEKEILAAINNGRTLENVPRELRTAVVCLAAINRHGGFELENIPL